MTWLCMTRHQSIVMIYKLNYISFRTLVQAGGTTANPFLCGVKKGKTVPGTAPVGKEVLNLARISDDGP